MKKPIKIMSKAALAALFTTSAIVPAAMAAPADTPKVQQSVDKVVVEYKGKKVSISLADYSDLLELGKVEVPSHIVLSNGNVYTIAEYADFFELNDDMQSTATALDEKGTVVDLGKVPEGTLQNGEIIIVDETPSTKEDLAKAIDEAKAALEEVEADKKADLDAAIKEAEVVAEKEDATAEEITEAVKALNKAVAEAKGPAVAVESVKAINTTVENGTSVKDVLAKLGTTVTGQLNDEAKTEVELNVEWSAPEDFDATKAGEYTFTGKVTVADEEATYTIGEDVVATAVVIVEEVKEAAYINSFEKVTTDLTAGSTGFTVKAVDQYGEVVEEIDPKNVEVKATLNTHLPLTAEIDANGFVTLTGATLAEGDDVVVTFTVKDGEEVKSTTEVAYTVIKGEEQVVSSVTLKADKTSVPSGQEITFTAESKDQYNNTMTTGATYTWVVNGEKVTDNTKATYKLTAKKPGEYTVTVVSNENTKVSATQKVVIGAAELTSVSVVDSNGDSVTTVKGYNTEAKTIGKVKYTEGAAVTAADVKFDIVATGDVTAEDISVVAEADEDGNIEVKATTAKDKSGSYKITPYVMYGETKVAAPTITYTSTKNPTLASISDFAFDAKELKVNSTITKEVTLTNVNGETLVVGADKDVAKDALTEAVVASDKTNNDGLAVTLNDTDKDGKTTLTFKATKADTYVVTLTGGAKFSPVTKTLAFVAPTVTTIEAGADVKDLVAKEDAKTKTHFQAISFADQDAVAIDVAKTDENLAVKVTQFDGKAIAEDNTALPTVEFVEIDKDGKKLESGTKANAVAVSAEKAAKGTYTIAVSYKVDKDTTVTDTFKVVVGEARQAKTVTVTPTSSTIAKGASSDFTVELLDQYEVPFNVDQANEITVVQKGVAEGQTAAVTVKKVAQAQKDGKNVDGSYKFTANVSATADTGNYTLVVTVPTADGQSITKEVTVKVDAGSNLATDIVVTGENIENGVAKLPVQVGKGSKLVNSKDEAYTLGLDVLDADGKKINYKASDVIWTSKTKGVTINAEDITVQDLVFAEGKTTADITLNAKYFGLNKDIKLTVSNEESTIQEGTLVAKQVKEEGKDPVEVTTVVIDKDAVDGVVELTFTGVDQFGKEVDAKELGLLSFDTSVATVAEQPAKEGKVQITAVKAGKTTAEVTIDNATTVLNIEVTAEAAEAAKAKADAEKEAADKEALEAAKTTAKDQLKAYKTADYTINKEDYDAAVKAGEKAIDKATETADVNSALTSAKEAIDAIDNDTKVEEKATAAISTAKTAIGTSYEFVTGTELTADNSATLTTALKAKVNNADITLTVAKTNDDTYSVKISHENATDETVTVTVTVAS